MRIAVDIDEDIALAIERLRKERGLTTSEAVNALVRAGLPHELGRRRFHQRTTRSGLAVDVANVAEALEDLDEPTVR